MARGWRPDGTWVARMALYYRDKLFHSNELSPLLSRFRKSFLGSIINIYGSIRRFTHRGSNRPGLHPTLHCEMPRSSLPINSSELEAEKHTRSQFDKTYSVATEWLVS
jgi:hypothetical protein